jgi:hypothetical protein
MAIDGAIFHEDADVGKMINDLVRWYKSFSNALYKSKKERSLKFIHTVPKPTLVLVRLICVAVFKNLNPCWLYVNTVYA